MSLVGRYLEIRPRLFRRTERITVRDYFTSGKVDHGTPGTRVTRVLPYEPYCKKQARGIVAAFLGEKKNAANWAPRIHVGKQGWDEMRWDAFGCHACPPLCVPVLRLCVRACTCHQRPFGEEVDHGENRSAAGPPAGVPSGSTLATKITRSIIGGKTTRIPIARGERRERERVAASE